MEEFLEGLDEGSVKVYMNDIIAVSRFEREHEEHLTRLFEGLKEFRLKVSREKSPFFRPSVKFMEYLLSELGIHPNTGNVQAIKKLQPLSDVKGSIMGVISFYRRCLPGLTDRMEGWNRLTKKRVKLEITKHMLESFEWIFSITLNPEHNFTVQREREDDELRNLTNEISKLLLRSTPSLETLKIQSFVFNEFGNRVPDKEESEDCLCQAKKIKIKPKIDPSKVVCEVVYKTDFPENLSLQYCGFCPVHIVEGDGIVLDVDTEIGLLHYEGKYYGFSCEKAAYNFGKNPGFYKKAVLDYARRNPEYLDLLDLRQEAFEYRFVGNLVPKFPKRISERTKEVQCVDHPYEDYIDKKYEWNIWELKRDAVQLANILKCKTHSTQTDRSHFKEGVGTQTHFKREVACQTMRDSYTNVPKPSTFIFGLRGRRKEDQHKILLTRPVDEGPCKILERNIPSPCEFKEE
ncbi:hypothetical protein AAG570_009387 [Ranatra chinensis]|uniref:Cilia- and flagella-associated protein 206 n=1 Tax=Ranatra chinensis TaxID=642074 RepID=A0ABD0YPH3_9HEMI